MNAFADRSTSPDLQGQTILLIDDDLANLSLLSASLTRADLKVLIAYDGESGLQQAREAHPQIILLDVILPGQDGFDVCRRLKADAATQDIPVLFMTALSSTRDKIHAYEVGAADYVAKPVQIEELLARVRAHLALRNMTQHLHDQEAQVRQAIVEREQAEAARQISAAQLRAIVDQMPFDLWAMDTQLRYIVQNESSRKLFGDVVGKSFEASPAPEQHKAKWQELDRRVLAGEVLHDAYELDVAAQTRHYESVIAPVKVDEAIVGLVGMAMDVTERKQTDEELRHYREQLEELVAARTTELRAEIEERTRIQNELSQANRRLKLLSECNQALVRAADETGLLEKICRFIVELGGYPLVWVGLIERTDIPTVRLAAQAGEATAALSNLIEANCQLEHGPICEAIRSGQPCIVNDIQTEAGFASLIALPLQANERVLGALNIYAAQPQAFQPEEVNVLLELAGDLAYGILALRTRAEQQQAEMALAEQHHLMRTLIDAMPDRIYVKDTASRFLLANKMVAGIMGTTPEDVIGKRDSDFYAPDLAEQYYADEQALLASGQALIDREEPGLDLAGNPHWFSTTKVPVRDEHGNIKGFVGIGRDITARKQMELLLRQGRDELEARIEERMRELRQANDQLAGLNRIAQAITAPLQLDRVLEIIARSAAELLGSDAGAILLLDESREALTIASAYGLRAEVVRDTRDRVGENIAGWVVQTGQPRIANDLQHDAHFHNPASARDGILACASVPLIAGGKIIGTLDVHSKTNPQAFTPDHIQLLSMLASQAAIAIENARLYESLQQAHADLEVRVQQRTSELAALYRISEATQTAPSLDELYASIHAIVSELMPARNFYIALYDAAADLIRFPYYADEVDAPPTPAQPGAGLTEYVLRSGRPLLAQPHIYAELLERGEIEKIGAPPFDWLGVPLKSQPGETLGVMAVQTYTEMTRLTEAHQEVLMFVSHQVAMAITRKRAEEAQRENEARYRTLFEHASDALFLENEADEILDVNSRACELLGYSREELLAMKVPDLQAPEQRGQAGHVIKAELSWSGEVFEGLDIRRDGVRVPVEISTSHIGDSGLVLASVRDITERKRAEKHERDVAHNLRVVVEAVDELIACADLDTFFRRAVELAREKLGVERGALFLLDATRQQMIGTYGTDFEGKTTVEQGALFPPDSLAALLNSEAKSWIVEEKEQTHRSGNQRHTLSRGWVATTVIRVGAQPIGLFSNDTGMSHAPLNTVTQETIVVYCSLLGNIIERKRAEEKITQLNRALEHRTNELAALNNAGRLLASTLDLDPLLGLVMEQIKALVDAEAASVLLCTPSTVEGAPPDLVFAAATGPAATALIGTRMSSTTGIAGWVAQNRQSVQISDSQVDPRFTQRIDTLTGMTTHSLLAVPLVAKGTLVGVMEVINKHRGRFDAHDLEILEALSSSSAIAIDNARLYADEQHRAAALTRALEQQRELDRLQREFIQNVSHELRTPIGIILGYAELLESGELGELYPDQSEPIRIITRRAHMLRKLVEDITAILEIEAHMHSGQRMSLDLIALVQGAIAEFQIASEKAHLTLAAEIEAGTASILGDAVALRRVLDNLVSNAFKFTRAGGRVTVRLRSTLEKVILEVSDTGIGIAADKVGRIFDRFYQVDGSATRHYGGMGLGLALVKEIVETHGGQIEVVTEVNVGTTFTITLPVEV